MNNAYVRIKVGEHFFRTQPMTAQRARALARIVPAEFSPSAINCENEADAAAHAELFERVPLKER